MMAKAPRTDTLSDGKLLFVGLGNPGPKYEHTRHNIGFLLIDRLASRWGMDVTRSKFKGMYGSGHAAGRNAVLLKPQTYMNLSGQSVQAASAFFSIPPEGTLVIHDEIDLPWGAMRLKIGGGHGGHNGLRSVDKELGSKNYFRLRLGVGRPEHNDVAGYVLQRFDAMQTAELDDFLSRAEDAVLMLMQEGLKKTQNRMH